MNQSRRERAIRRKARRNAITRERDEQVKENMPPSPRSLGRLARQALKLREAAIQRREEGRVAFGQAARMRDARYAEQ